MTYDGVFSTNVFEIDVHNDEIGWSVLSSHPQNIFDASRVLHHRPSAGFESRVEDECR